MPPGVQQEMLPMLYFKHMCEVSSRFVPSKSFTLRVSLHVVDSLCILCFWHRSIKCVQVNVSGVSPLAWKVKG